MDFTKLTEKIEEFDTITIFRHQRPDCDALGSQFALLTWLQDNYPEKAVYALGTEVSHQCEFPKSDEVSDEVIRSSLALVVDTANTNRVDDIRCVDAKFVIKIDHHPNVDHYGDLMFVDDTAAAVCEILTLYFRSLENDHRISKQTAEFLYRGLLTDTLCYATSNTTARTLQAGAYIAEFGIDIPEINRTLFDKSLSEYQFASFIRNQITIMDGGKLGYVLLSDKTLQEWNVSVSEAKNYIDEFGHIRDFEVWAMFCEKKDNGNTLYDGSLRSKHVTINTTAVAYGGGGHKNASGVKNLSYERMMSILNDLNRLALSR